MAATLPGLGGRTFSSLRHHRNYRLFFAGQLVSVSGNQMQPIADAWLLLNLTDAPFSLGVLAAAQYLPFTLLGLFAGVVADRTDPQRLLIATQWALLAIASAMAALVLTGAVRPWQILGTGGLRSSAACRRRSRTCDGRPWR